MIEVTPFEATLVALTIGGLITYIFHLRHLCDMHRASTMRMFHAKMKKLDIPDGTIVRVEFD